MAELWGHATPLLLHTFFFSFVSFYKYFDAEKSFKHCSLSTMLVFFLHLWVGVKLINNLPKDLDIKEMYIYDEIKTKTNVSQKMSIFITVQNLYRMKVLKY